MIQPDEILDFWFDESARGDASARKVWFVRDDAFDAQIRRRFGAALERAIRGQYDGWAQSARGRLALIIMLDQFSRNLFRGSPRSWCQDPLALKLALEGIDQQMDAEVGVVERVFFYLPLEHAEDKVIQALSVQKFADRAALDPHEDDGGGGFYDYAVKHRDVIERFGRFPHRNEVLGRPNTDAETEFLAQPGSSF